MREKTYHLYLNEEERSRVIQSLIELKNNLAAQGRYTDAVDDGLKLTGWALNSEYFCSILHELRNDMSYRAIVEKIVEVPEHADTRDTEAIKRLATAYLKLLFPNVRNEFDVDKIDFIRPSVL